MAELLGGRALALGAALALNGTAVHAQSSGGVAMETAVPVAAQPIQFNPPLGQPLTLRISDSRLLPNGRRVDFAVEHRVEFLRGDGGLLASIEQMAVQCSGLPTACAAFEAMSAPQMYITRRFAVSTAGDVHLLNTAPPVHAGTAAIVTQMEQQSAGSVTNAELTEALFFIGMALPASGEVTENEIFGGNATGEAALLPPLEQRRTSQIDRTTGLLTRSVQTTQETTGAQRLLSERVWTLSLSPQTMP